MKLVYIVDSYPKLSETFILNEILELTRCGHRVSLHAFTNTRETVRHPGAQNIETARYLQRARTLQELLSGHLFWLTRHPLRYLSALGQALNPFSFNPGLWKVFPRYLADVRTIAEAAPDHVHAHFAFRPAHFALLIHLLSGIPYTFTAHRRDIFMNPSCRYPALTRRAVRLITISEFNKRYLVSRFRVSPEKIAVVHCGIDLNRSLPARSPGTSASVLCVGRLSPEKGIDILIRSCALLKQAGIPFSCTVVGDGPERERLTRLIDSLDLRDTVTLAGAKTQDEVFQLLARATVAALASRSEGIPVTLMEAMAMKVPVVATRITGIPELVADGESGFLVPPEDPEAFAGKLRLLLDSAELRGKFGETGFRKVVSEFNLQTEVRKLAGFWMGGSGGELPVSGNFLPEPRSR